MTKLKYPKYPQVDSKNFRAWNGKMFKKYNNERVYNHINPVIRFIERKRVRLVLKNLNQVNKNDRILAAGCGEGYIESKINSGKLHLVDISKEAIKRAKENLKHTRRAKFYLADLENLPFEKNYFDYIECSEVIEHVLSPQKLLDELHRVLKEDGKLIITFPNEPLINFIKKIFIKLHLFELFFPNVPTDMLEEWHLRSYDLNSFKGDSKEKWSIQTTSATPCSYFPIRHIIVCKKS